LERRTTISNRECSASIADVCVHITIVNLQLIEFRSPVIDGHVDLPELARQFYGNDINAFDLNKNIVRSHKS